MKENKGHTNLMKLISYSTDNYFGYVRDAFFIGIVSAGSMMLQIDDIVHYIGTRSLICLPSGIKCTMLFSHNIRMYSLVFQPTFLDDTFTDVQQEGGILDLFFIRNYAYRGVLMLSEQNYSSIMKIYFSIIQELQCQGDEFWLSRAKNKLLTLLNTAKTTYDLYRQMHALKVNEIHKQIYDIIEYINMSLNKKLNIQQICKKFCTNHTTLAKNFKSIMGITVNEYIRNQRIALVKQSLAYTDLTLDEIAYSHGFNSTSYLSEVFKKSTHFTPMQYRNHVRNSREGNRI